METVDYALFQPLVFGAILYVVLFVSAAVLDARGAEERAEGLRDISFLIVLLAAAWVIVLVLVGARRRAGPGRRHAHDRRRHRRLLRPAAVRVLRLFELMIGRGPRRAAGRDNG